MRAAFRRSTTFILVSAESAGALVFNRKRHPESCANIMTRGSAYLSLVAATRRGSAPKAASKRAARAALRERSS